MEHNLPIEVLSEIELRRQKIERKGSRLWVSAENRRHRVLQISDKGFVIEADGLPHLRGFVDIMRLDERIARRLVMCVWARDGLVGYEFKHDNACREIAVDYVKPTQKGLLEGPGSH